MKLLLLITGLFLASILHAQEIGDDLLAADTSMDVILRKEIEGGIQLHSQGWGLQFRRGSSITAFKKRLMEFDLVSMRSPKEIKTVHPFFNNSKSYVYGKLNSVYVLRAGLGYHRQLNRKPRSGGIEVRYFYSVGPTLALSKPIYLHIINYMGSWIEYDITTERYDPDQHFVDNIYGRASFFKGFDQIGLHPGAYARFGFNFDYSREHEKIRTLEIGATLDAYPFTPVPIMAFNDKEYYFLTVYLSFNIGHRYNRQLTREDLGIGVQREINAADQ